MDGRMRNAQIEQKKEDLILACKAFYLASKKPMPARNAGDFIETIFHRTEELMRAQREIP